MSLEHIDLLHSELPELFQTRELVPDWHEDLIIVPVRDPEGVTQDDRLGKVTSAGAPPDYPMELPEDELLEKIGPEVIQPNAPVPDLGSIIVQVLGGAHSGAPVPYTHQPKMPPPESLAFYLPFHYYHPDWWGVYLLFEGVLWLAGEILRQSRHKVSRRQAFEAARLFLYYHEALHHKTECFATRLELTHRRAFYKTGFERLYQNTLGRIECLEEALGNASGLEETWKKMREPLVDEALRQYVGNSPPGYDEGNRVRPIFLEVRCQFAEDNQRICLPHLPGKDFGVWRTAPHLFHGISNIKSRVNYVLPRDSPLAARLPFRPCLPPSKLIKQLRERVELDLVREGRRHQIWKTSSGRLVEIPRHPRDLGRGLLRKILRETGISMGIEEFLGS